MAHKLDTFWENHPPVGGGAPYAPGLRTYEAVGNLRFAAQVVLSTLGVVVLIALMAWAEDWMNLLCFLALFQVLVWPGLANAAVRYRLYDDDKEAPEFDGEPKKLRDLLRLVAKDERLWQRLAPPEQLAYPPPSVLRRVLPMAVVLVPALVVLGTIYLLPFVMLALLPPYPVTEFVPPVVILLGGMLLLLPTWFAHRQLSAGTRLFGAGDLSLDGEDVKARFARVSEVRLDWDRWLGAPYLLLDLDGTKVRYYSPLEDRLHLLRLAKYRMPHLELQA